MNKPYYKDRLAKEWMNKHFGMKFDISIDGKFYTVDELLEHFSGKTHPDFCEARYYIHPDSLKLLHVRIGDLVLDEQGVNGIRVMLKLQLPSCLGAIILERDDKPFMWPEVE